MATGPSGPASAGASSTSVDKYRRVASIENRYCGQQGLVLDTSIRQDFLLKDSVAIPFYTSTNEARL